MNNKKGVSMVYLIFSDLHSFDTDNLKLILDSFDTILFLGEPVVFRASS